VSSSLPKSLPKNIHEVFNRSTLIFSKQDVDTALDKMAKDISARFSQSAPILLCVVIGGIVPLGSLLPRLDFPLEVDYIHATRYTGKTLGDQVLWKARPTVSLEGRVVIVVDDILDAGLTLAAIVDYCNEQKAKEVCTAVLLDKQKTREKGGLEKPDFYGLVVEDRYLFGYGLDYKRYLRNANGIYAVDPSDI
jgi:hypoxanthine phosphoribosyltransferase